MSTMTDSEPARALDLFAEHGGMLRTSRAIRLGIHPPNPVCASGMPPRSNRSRPPLSIGSPVRRPLPRGPILVPIAVRIPRAVVCLISALAQHGLTTQVPHAVDIALPSHAQSSGS